MPLPAAAAKKRRKALKKKPPPPKAIQAYKKEKAKEESDYESSDAEDYSDDEDEGKEGYKKGGYHPVKVDELYNGRYRVKEKLGWGHFSTVWLCDDEKRSNAVVALKIVKSASHYTEAAVDEIKILQALAKHDPDNKKCVVSLIDSFEHKGPHGKHMCMVFEVLGSNLLDLIKRYNYRGIPVPVVKSITKQMLIGLDYMHKKCNVIHTDLKPENVLLISQLPARTKRKRSTTTQDVKQKKSSKSKSNSSASDRSEESEESEDDKSDDEEEEKDKSDDEEEEDESEEDKSDDEEESDEEDVKKSTRKGKKRDSDAEEEEEEEEDSRIIISEVSNQSTMDSLSHLTIDMRDDSESDYESLKKSRDDMDMSPASSQPQDKDEEKEEESVKEEKKEDKKTHIKIADIDVDDPSTYKVKIADFGNACWTNEHFTNDIQTRQYRAPEVILGSKWGPAVDIWSLACMVFELSTGDLLFEPKSSSSFDKNDDHLGQMIELLGKMPKRIATNGKHSRDFFTSKGELKYIRNLHFWKLEDVFVEKYKWTKEDAKDIASFIMPMLEFDQEKRASAAEMLKHKWIQNAHPLLDSEPKS